MNNPIGIFDSGVGGLTVFHSIKRALPHQDIVYFGDTARVPYGSKSQRTIIQYSLQNMIFLLQQKIELLVVACNTSSAYAIDELTKRSDIPIIGVIDPGAKKALQATENKRIGVIGTEGTIKSGSYEKALKSIDPFCTVFSKATPLLVPLVEENWIDHNVTKEIIHEYLDDFLENDLDTIIMGCTHYPVLKHVIRDVVGDSITLVDSADSIAEELMSRYGNDKETRDAQYDFYVSDNPEKFNIIGRQIVGEELYNIKKVFFTDAWVADNYEV
ncbi:MAG: glutamate racemase [Candidatus Cloacimonetes bacterium]|nr:glutamate racemase [Candidatus Cloacimonadota bacterium]